MHSKTERIAKEAQFRVLMPQGSTSGFVLGSTGSQDKPPHGLGEATRRWDLDQTSW